jgi:oligopeptide/dipeptide ABC transporter ATP-binding protein
MTTTSGNALEVRDLSTHIQLSRSVVQAVGNVDISIATGETVGLVGESGSGKSMTAKAVARLLPDGAESGGAIRYDGGDVTALKGHGLRDYRGEVAMVFQDPRAHVNPVRTVGDFMGEALRSLRGVSAAEARERAIAALADVGIDDGERRLRQYPHELSGGLLQRVMIATMLLTEPRLVLADEPTTALDVTTQAEVMAILDELRRDRGMALLFITHDLELAGAVCDRTSVMYAGQIVETRESAKLHDDPLHPYTASLATARPTIDATVHRLAAIPGRPVSAFEAPDGCPFAPRCSYAQDACRAQRPPVEELDGGLVRCLRAAELRGELTGAVQHG